MSFTLWGLLSKAQDNPQTIDEAIADAIAVHNDDPTAHLGTGRSLEAHKTNEVLDHVAGSVLNDKMSMTEYSLIPNLRDNTFFTSLLSVGEYDDSNPPGVNLSLFDSSGYAFRIGLILGITNQLNYNKDMLIQYNFVINEHSNYDAYLFYGYLSGDTLQNGFGFKIVDDVLKGFYVSTSGVVYTSSMSFSNGVIQSLRAQYNKTLGVIDYYVNGVLQNSLTVSNGKTSGSSPRFWFGVKSSSSSSAVSLFVFDTLFSLQL